jgi:hypothetical protein
MLFIYVLQVMQIIRALKIDTFPDMEVLAVFYTDERSSAVRAFKVHVRKAVLVRRELSAADRAA